MKNLRQSYFQMKAKDNNVISSTFKETKIILFFLLSVMVSLTRNLHYWRSFSQLSLILQHQHTTAYPKRKEVWALFYLLGPGSSEKRLKENNY